MFKIKNYRLGFDIWGLILLLVIMRPNFVRFAVPAVNDVLRNESVTPHIDMAASVFRAVMAAALCVVINRHRQKPAEKALLIGIGVSILLYYAGWDLYCFRCREKNAAALIPAGVFTLCHVLYAVVNFIV